jgi:hypothetical protein
VGGGLALTVPVELGFRRRRLWGRIHHWRLRGGWGEGGGVARQRVVLEGRLDRGGHDQTVIGHMAVSPRGCTLG